MIIFSQMAPGLTDIRNCPGNSLRRLERRQTLPTTTLFYGFRRYAYTSIPRPCRCLRHVSYMIGLLVTIGRWCHRRSLHPSASLPCSLPWLWHIFMARGVSCP
ncbi:uncharacterized protein BT62DRAFT_151823 [Guyanagaster necrorhizus]|uniref:Uncharacterized protein n=1 Tax=Guyanagaster necrorhizus TaxID=856835 RepID=A0A9P7VU33_9AGAR|nr:uncharacterized protein BT62DRAFT_151823 [Guyanagaster necrorhizus MCA 3950]KAG7446084.1 hypothetical protein BT62DRAFT_151823 [Guyanagaster necrorhizus MCA 3950]